MGDAFMCVRVCVRVCVMILSCVRAPGLLVCMRDFAGKRKRE